MSKKPTIKESNTFHFYMDDDEHKKFYKNQQDNPGQDPDDLPQSEEQFVDSDEPEELDFNRR